MRSIRSMDLGEASGYIALKFTLCRVTRQHYKMYSSNLQLVWVRGMSHACVCCNSKVRRD